MGLKIRAGQKEDTLILADIIRRSFKDVAERFLLNATTAPAHPSNCTPEWVQKDMERGVTYFILGKENHGIGCVALEQANSQTCHLERLAVLPDQRTRGFGKLLVQHVLSEAKRLNAGNVNIGIIAENTELKNWYRKMGFVEGESKDFPHLPFRVTFMDYVLG